MLPVRKIVCTTDFSDASLAGIKAADELANQFSAEIHLIHVVAPVPVVATAHGAPVFDIPSYEKELVGQAETMLAETISENFSPGVSVTPKVLRGEPAERIARAAEDLSADLIVIATHGQTGWRRFISGSVAERVVRLASCPVLSVHGASGRGGEKSPA